MPDASTHLDYSDPGRDPRVRRRRRLWLVALVLSALAAGMVGRMLYLRVRPALTARWELYVAQRDVDALAARGVAYELGPVTAHGARMMTVSLSGGEVTGAASRYLATHVARAAGNAAMIGRVRDAAGRERVVCLMLLFGGTSPVESAQLVAWVREPATLFGGTPAPPASFVLPLVTFRDRFAFDAPTIDATDGRRVLLGGDADGTAFAFELTLDANDRPSLIAIPAPATRSTP